MRSSNSASREYDSFNPAHQAIYRPLTVVGWKPYRLTPMQRCGRFGRVVLESAVLFVFQKVPSVIGKCISGLIRWGGSRIQKPAMATVKVVEPSAASSAASPQQIQV